MERKLNKVIRLTKQVFKIVNKKMPDNLGWLSIGENIKIYKTKQAGLWYLTIENTINISTLKNAETIEFNYLKTDRDLNKTIKILERYINLNKKQ